MPTAMIAVLNSEKLAAGLGKKGSESDMTMYNHRKGERTLTVVAPTRFPEKVPPLLYSLYLCPEVIMVVDRLDRTVGEAMVACDVLGKDRGVVILENYIQPEQLAPLVRDTILEKWTLRMGTGDPNVLRESLMEKEAIPREGTTRVTVDQSFSVKGVGTVCLGIVDRGKVARHQQLEALPSKKSTVVRSIQVHDEDQEETGSGSRVGLALKNIEPEDVPRGSVLSPAGSHRLVTEFRMKLRVNRFWKDQLTDGMGMHVACGMQFEPVRVSMDGTLKGGEEGVVTVRPESGLVIDDTDRPVLVWLESSGPRIVGAGDIAG